MVDPVKKPNFELVDKANAYTFEVQAQLIRFLVLSNAGGAVAVLSFLGATATKGIIIKGAVAPLALFSLGIIFSGLTLITQFIVGVAHTRRAQGKEPRRESHDKGIKKKAGLHLASAVLSFVFLVLGIVVGLLMIVLS